MKGGAYAVVVHHAVGLRQRQGDESVVVHGIPYVAGASVLLGENVVEAAAHHGGVRPRVRIVPVGENRHHAETYDGRLPSFIIFIGTVCFLGVL